MDNSFKNVSEHSNFMDLTLSPDISDNYGEHQVKVDRPPRNYGKRNSLRSIQELPQKYRCVFEFPYFNIIQSNILDDVLYSDVSVVISSPTGSGKTIVFELAIIRLLMNFEEINYVGVYKIIYVAPIKSLCHERLSDWHIKFTKIGISCIVCTGDNENMDYRCLKNYHIIITTPEKWDSLTRNAKDSEFFDSVKLFMIDEVHLLKEETRGPTLEVIVSRMKIMKKNIRFLAVSATIPNIEDIAEWLGKENESAVYFKNGEELRPVKLNKIVIGYPCSSESATFKFDLMLNYKLQSILLKYAEGKPTLIFCSTRKGVELTASHLSQNLTFHLTPPQLSLLSSAASTMFSSLHKTFLSNGIGCHHAGMSLENRTAVENLFREGQLPVLVATSTLAMGVNLPAHLVVVKGTKQYVGGFFQEYGESSLLQMIGRAGRPQFDSSATVVIMTTVQEKSRYEKKLGGTELIESNLHRHLTEHLNAEVALGTITDIAIALEWLRNTFLYVRVLKNPKHYNIPMNYTKNQVEKKLQDLCQIEINALNKHGMLQIDQVDGFSLSATNMGKLMANYYLAFDTMKHFAEIKGNETLSEILMILSKCNEFSETYLRVNDKKTLNTLNRCKYQETIRFPLKTTIKTTPMKIYCIIQATLGCIRIQNPALQQESIKIMRIGERIANCLVEYLLHKSNHFSAFLNSVILRQCFHAKIWENSPYVSRQFPKIGNVLSSMLVSAGKTSFKTILETNPRDIERIINRGPPMGNDILEAIKHLPLYKINLEPCEVDKFKIKITVFLTNSEDINKKCTVGTNSFMTLLIGDGENNVLLCKKLYHHTMALCKEFTYYINVILRVDHVIQVYLISENWVGIDCKENYDIIINHDSITTKTGTHFVNNNNLNSAQQTNITSYFTSRKKTTKVDNKKPNIKKTKNNTIDTYFDKKNKNEKLLVPNYTEIEKINETQISSIKIPDSGFVSMENDSNDIPNRTNHIENQSFKNMLHCDYTENFNNINEENITFHPLNNKEHFEKIYPDINKGYNNEYLKKMYPEINNKPTVIHPFEKIYNKCVPKFDEYNKKLSLKSQNNYTTTQENFERFSQNLAKKFPQPSQNLSQSSIFTNTYPQITQNSNSPSDTNITKKLETNLNLKSTLNKFKFIPYQKINHHGIKTLPKYSSKTETNNSQISANTFSNNVELDKFRQYMESKQRIETITSQTQNLETQNFEMYPVEFCETTFNENVKENNLNSSLNPETINISSSSESSTHSKTIEDTKENLGINNKKPYFPKSFKEYVQNSIDKLKKSTLVNEYFNYDIGFQEFLMGPLEENSDDDDSENESKKETKKIEENLEETPNLKEENLEIDSFVSPEFSGPVNITFSCSGEILNKTENISPVHFSPQNLSFHSNIFTHESNFPENTEPQFNQNSENSEFSCSSAEFSEKSTLKIEGRIKLIEQYYNNPLFTANRVGNNMSIIREKSPEIFPVKRHKFSGPPKNIPISRSKKYFKDPVKSKDTFKKMPPLKRIMSIYGNQYENTISFSKNNEKKIIDEPVINEIVKKTAYNYLMEQETKSVEMSVTIYEKETKSVFDHF